MIITSRNTTIYKEGAVKVEVTTETGKNSSYCLCISDDTSDDTMWLNAGEFLDLAAIICKIAEHEYGDDMSMDITHQVKVDEILQLLALLDRVLITESESALTLYYGTVEEVPWPIRNMETIALHIEDKETLQIEV